MNKSRETIKQHTTYLKYVFLHKWHVFQASRELGVSTYQGIFHDWSKFLPSEWFSYVNTFYKADGTKQYVETPAFAMSWLLHQRRNKHHWQYWLLYWDRGELIPMPMPEKYVREMVADWIGAGIAITGKRNTKGWYSKNKNKIKLHIETRTLVEKLLDEQGEIIRSRSK